MLLLFIWRVKTLLLLLFIYFFITFIQQRILKLIKSDIQTFTLLKTYSIQVLLLFFWTFLLINNVKKIKKLFSHIYTFFKI